MKKANIFESGQSLVEVVVALAVMAMLLLALVAIGMVAIRNATFSKNQALATKYAQELIEEARNLRDTQFVDFFSNETLCERGEEEIGGFTRKRECTLEVEGDKKKMNVKVTVKWNDAKGEHKSELTTELTNWR